MSRAAVVLPGRGAFTAAALEPPDEAQAILASALDERRGAAGLLPLGELMSARVFVPAIHLRPANVAPLIYLASLRDAAAMAAEHETVAVLGNGLGWCSALAVAGALDVLDGLRLVQEIGMAQDPGTSGDRPAAASGGQLLYPLTDADWRPIADRRRTLASALERAEGGAWLSIELGPHAVLGGSAVGLETLMTALPPVAIAGDTYPRPIALSSAEHTPLASDVADAVQRGAAQIVFRQPHTTLIDGRGMRHTPWSTDPAELADYTLRAYLVSTYRFATALRVALREYAPDLLLLPGPGTSLAGVVGALVVAEGYRGIRDRTTYEATQAGERPLVVSQS